MSLFTAILTLPVRLVDAVVAIPEAIRENTTEVRRIAAFLERNETPAEVPDSLGDQVDAMGAAIDQSAESLGGAVTRNT